MKRLSIVLAALGLSTSVLAALPAATDPTVVQVPCLPGGFVIGGTAFYLQPSDSAGDLDYAVLNTTVSGSNPSIFSSEVKNVEPGYNWGWGVNIGYIFPGTGNDVNLSYFQLDTDDTADFGVANASTQYINPVESHDFFPYLQTTTDGLAAAGKAEYDINQVDLTVGQYIDVGCRLILHPNVGLRWAQIDRTLTSAIGGLGTSIITNGNFGQTYVDGYKDDSSYSGIGPILGLDASYYIGMGFGAVGHFDSAVLIGSIDDTQDVAFGNYTTNTAIYAYQNKTDSTNRVVPVVDAKLGLDYTYMFNNASNSDLTLELGWQFSNYFNAVDRVVSSGLGSSNSITGHKTTDLGLNGPYLSLVFHV